ncbi:hypothetical protein RB653_010097 [Dictyostelium firmibasis]|uniref:Ankyrin repeat-containing protein n=1 Tax=Dictyostelium firmibasis TaxID=79012 RepID=A0AAN7TT82_9MYCE
MDPSIFTSLKGVDTNEDLSVLATTFTTSRVGLNSSQSRVTNSLHQLKLEQQQLLLQQKLSSNITPPSPSTSPSSSPSSKTMLLSSSSSSLPPKIMLLLSASSSLPASSSSSSSLSSSLSSSKERANIIRNINFLKNSVENFFTSNKTIYEEGSSSFNINDFPEEILIHILKWLSPFDLRVCCLVSNYWSIISSQNPIWYEKCYSQWHWCYNINQEKLNRLGGDEVSWKEFYKFWAKEYLKYAEWWQESFSREDANQVLSTMGKGTFLIRASTSKKNCLVISYNVHAQTPNHMLLSYLGLYTGVSLYDEIGRVYPTLASLIRGKKSWLKRPFQSCSYINKSNQKLKYINDKISEIIHQQQQQQQQQLVSSKEIDKLSLLHIACKWSFKPIVIKLLCMGADINHKSTKSKKSNSNGIKKGGKPPLFFAIGFVHGQPQSNIRLEIVKLLLEHQKLDINQLDSKGRSICHIACKQHQQDSLDILKLLLKYGANPHLPAPNGYYPLHWAVKENNLKMVKLLLSITSPEIKTEGENNINSNSNNKDEDLEIVKELVKNERDEIKEKSSNIKINIFKVDINCKIESTPISRINGDNGTTPLHLAASKNFIPIIKLLLEHPNIDIDFRDNSNKTALHLCVSNPQDWVNIARFGKPLQHHFSHQTIELLIKNKSNLNLLDNQGKTPLHIAIEKGHRKSTHLIATTLRDTFSKEFIQSVYSKKSLYQSLKNGSESKDIQKIVADVNYSIMCGYNEDFIEPLDKTIIDHYNNISDILKKDFFPLLDYE